MVTLIPSKEAVIDVDEGFGQHTSICYCPRKKAVLEAVVAGKCRRNYMMVSRCVHWKLKVFSVNVY